MSSELHFQLTFDIGSGRGKQSLYPQSYKVAGAQVVWTDGRDEEIVLTYYDHGQWRDVFTGQSKQEGHLIFKMQPASYDSIRQEVALLSQGMGGLSIRCLWSGQVQLPESHVPFAGLLQLKAHSTVDEALKKVANRAASAASLEALLEIVEGSMSFIVEVCGKFDVTDIGPCNLGILADRQVVSVNWEHCTAGKSARRKINKAVKQLVTTAAAYMSTRQDWNVVGRNLVSFVCQDWLFSVPDATIYSNDKGWLRNGLQCVGKKIQHLALCIDLFENTGVGLGRDDSLLDEGDGVYVVNHEDYGFPSPLQKIVCLLGVGRGSVSHTVCAEMAYRYLRVKADDLVSTRGCFVQGVLHLQVAFRRRMRRRIERALVVGRLLPMKLEDNFAREVASFLR